MYTKRYLSLSIGAACLGAMAVIGSASAAPVSRVVANNLPGFAKGSKDLGATDAAKTIDVMIWLKVRNQAELDQLAVDLYDAASPNYRHWITPAQFGERFAPAAADAASVKAFFEANGLSVVETGAKNMFVRARGSVANVNKAFHVQLHDFSYKGRTVYANTTEPLVSGPAAAVTLAVYGLHNLDYTHPNAQPIVHTPSSSTGPSLTAERSFITAATAPSISSDCFPGTETETLKTNGNSYPYATVKGNGYATQAGSIGGCGYTPPEIQKAYNLTKLYEEGFDGTGQTIVIIDWCGSPTIRADANAFSAAYGLPALTTTNFLITNSSTPPTCASPDPEINIDVEWAHAIAPGAAIDLVVPPTASFADVDSGEFFAIINHLGSVISGSYGSEEAFDAPAEVTTENLINEIAAVQGIAANFSSGDGGDYTSDFPEYNPASVIVPADSPYATAVGGISLALNSSKTIKWQAGWGTNVTPIDSEGFVIDPPSGFFNGGSGGGPSAVFSKPAYQKKLKGSSRLLPDISWLADPFTGGVIVISEPFQFPAQTYQIYGGTSLACPMFSALWAIANQEAGNSGPLGQAAPYLYSMPASTILDVKPVSSSTNVTAAYKESATVTDVYTAADLADPLEGTTKFISAIWNYPLYEDTVYVLTFGTDSGLKTATGWDDVTGVGVPNGKAFADYFKQ